MFIYLHYTVVEALCDVAPVFHHNSEDRFFVPLRRVKHRGIIIIIEIGMDVIVVFVSIGRP
jgi:hypothetical protein